MNNVSQNRTNCCCINGVRKKNVVFLEIFIYVIIYSAIIVFRLRKCVVFRCSRKTVKPLASDKGKKLRRIPFVYEFIELFETFVVSYLNDFSQLRTKKIWPFIFEIKKKNHFCFCHTRFFLFIFDSLYISKTMISKNFNLDCIKSHLYYTNLMSKL